MFNNGSTSLKWFKRLGIYKNSTGTVEFDPSVNKARSYNWTFLAPINGVLVFNDYNWSSTTSCHQSAVSSLLNSLGIKYIRVDAGREDVRDISINTMRKLYKGIVEAQIDVELTVRKETWTYKRRVNDFNDKTIAFETLEGIDKKLKLSQKEKKRIRQEVYDSKFQDLNDDESIRSFKRLTLTQTFVDTNEVTL